MNDYRELREHLAHASTAGIPSNVRNKFSNKNYNKVEGHGVPSNVGWKAAGSNALSGYKSKLDSAIKGMVSLGKEANASWINFNASAKACDAKSRAVMDALNNYNEIVRQARSIGNKASFLKASVNWKSVTLSDGTVYVCITSCTLTPTDADPGNQNWG